jgi:hypothetical protein
MNNIIDIGGILLELSPVEEREIKRTLPIYQKDAINLIVEKRLRDERKLINYEEGKEAWLY